MNRILIVEDEKSLQRNIALLLSNENYEVFTADDGMEALKILKENTPDLIISDIMMPYLDGFELFQKVKENSRTKIIPFIFLTAKTSFTSIRQGMNLGADDYITKPFNSDELLRAVKIRLEKSKIMNDQIENIRSSISKYVPHELRTPLVAILGYSQILIEELENLPTNEVREIIERINFGANRLHNRIEKFIQLTELETHKNNIWAGEEDKSVIDKDLLKEISIGNYVINERKGDIEISVVDADLKIPDRYLRIMLKELLENAVKFSTSGTSIIVDGKKEGSHFVLEIKDYGIGFDDTQISQVGAFQQFNRDIIQQEGNGLGLVFVDKILQIIGGKIKIESVKDQHTIVIITIPLA
ncbi:MAG: response regulator [bacterium]